MNHLLAIGRDPQEGLDGIVDALLFTSRYVSDNIHSINGCLNLLFDAGGKLDGYKIFDPNYLEDEVTLEDEIHNYYSKALLAMFLDPQMYVKNWDEIKPVYWEDIPEGTDFETARLMYLKYCYNHIKRVHIWE